MRTMLAAALLASAAGPACAQDGPWTYEGTVYFWASSTTSTLDTRFGELETELSFSDALEQLDFAFSGAFEASNGVWSLVGDVFYFRLSETSSIDVAGFDRVRTESELWGVTGYAFYRVASAPNFFLDLGGGLRVYALEQEVQLRGDRPGAGIDVSETWTDPLIAARLRYDFNERWYANLAADYGGFGGSNDQSWNVLATLGYAFNDRWSIRGGYRLLEIDREIDDRPFSNRMDGPILGVTYRF